VDAVNYQPPELMKHSPYATKYSWATEGCKYFLTTYLLNMYTRVIRTRNASVFVYYTIRCAWLVRPYDFVQVIELHACKIKTDCLNKRVSLQANMFTILAYFTLNISD
jgi:hypothetical protein